QGEDPVGGQPVVPFGGPVLVRGRQVVGPGIDLGRHPDLRPPRVNGGHKDAVGIEQPRVEHRPGQAGTQDQDPEVGFGDGPDAVADLGQGLAEQGGTWPGPGLEFSDELRYGARPALDRLAYDLAYVVEAGETACRICYRARGPG